MITKIKRIVGIVLLSLILVTSVFFAYVRFTDETPVIFGYSVCRVYSDTMEPKLSLGDIIIVKEVAPETLEKGDVITYLGKKGMVKGELVTHQISKEPYEKDGVYYFTTRGIKDGIVDDPEITHKQIRGEAQFKIPYLGTVYDFFTTWYGLVCVFIVLVIAFSDDAVAVYTKIREKKAIENEPEHTNATDIKQSEDIESQRELEFEGIIMNLDDPDL